MGDNLSLSQKKFVQFALSYMYIISTAKYAAKIQLLHRKTIFASVIFIY